MSQRYAAVIGGRTTSRNRAWSVLSSAGITPYSLRRWQLKSGEETAPLVIVIVLDRPKQGTVTRRLGVLRRRYSASHFIVIASHMSRAMIQSLIDVPVDDVVSANWDGWMSLAWRVEHAWRLHTACVHGEFRWGDAKCHGLSRTVTLGGKSVELSPRLFQLLVALAEAEGSVLPSRRIAAEAWHMAADRSDPAGLVAYSVHQLRQRLKAIDCGNCIRSIPGRGYLARSPRSGRTHASTP